MAATVLSIQSGVAFGHVGNAAAVFALMRLGVDVMRIDTVRFSNHPAHGGFAGAAAPAEEIAGLVDGLAAQGFLARADAVLSGYLGTATNGAAVADVVTCRKEDGGLVYLCDPVMGDHPKGLFVAPDIPAVFRDRLVPMADIVTPNPFELEQLTGIPALTRDSALDGARALLAKGPRLVVVTGLDAGRGIETLAVAREGAWACRTPRVAAPAFGAGDTFAAIFLARWLEAPDPARALAYACSSLHALLAATRAAGADELALVAGQEALVVPSPFFPAERLA